MIVKLKSMNKNIESKEEEHTFFVLYFIRERVRRLNIWNLQFSNITRLGFCKVVLQNDRPADNLDSVAFPNLFASCVVLSNLRDL